MVIHFFFNGHLSSASVIDSKSIFITTSSSDFRGDMYNNDNNNNNNNNNNKYWVDFQRGIVSSHGERDPL